MRGQGSEMAYVVACKVMSIKAVSDDPPMRFLQGCLTRWSSTAWSNIPTQICLDYKCGVSISY